MSGFRVGQQVRCRKSRKSDLILGEIYTVTELLKQPAPNIRIAEHPEKLWSKDRFLPVEAENRYSIRPACFDLPPDNCVPESARQIYDMGRPKLNDRQRDQADGVARAVGNLSHFEPRLGAARFQP